MKNLISILLENEPGALSRVVALFSARGYNIESLSVSTTQDPSLSRMTIKTTGSDEVVEQITKHLNRLIDVVKVVNLTDNEFIERELILIKVRATGKNREEMKRMAEIFRGSIVDVTDKTYTIELTGNENKFLAFLTAIDEDSIISTRTNSSNEGGSAGNILIESNHVSVGSGGSIISISSGDGDAGVDLGLAVAGGGHDIFRLARPRRPSGVQGAGAQSARAILVRAHRGPHAEPHALRARPAGHAHRGVRADPGGVRGAWLPDWREFHQHRAGLRPRRAALLWSRSRGRHGDASAAPPQHPHALDQGAQGRA